MNAYERVRAAIVENRYAPGQRLVEQRIAEELGLSRTPVREALRLLEAEGLVVSERNRGAMVRPLSDTEEDLGALEAAADAFTEARTAGGVDSLAGVRRLHEANRDFHDVIIRAARHRRLETMLARTVDIPLVFQAFRRFGAAEITRADTFKHLIAEAVRRRDAARAASLMGEHIAYGRDAVLGVSQRVALPVT